MKGFHGGKISPWLERGKIAMRNQSRVPWMWLARAAVGEPRGISNSQARVLQLVVWVIWGVPAMGGHGLRPLDAHW